MYKKNDILTKDGYFIKVLEIYGDIYFMSHSNEDISSSNLKRYNYGATEYDLRGWTLHSSEKEKFVPKIEENYYYIDNDGEIIGTTNCKYSTNKARISLGNCFPFTPEGKAEAEKYAEKFRNLFKN